MKSAWRCAGPDPLSCAGVWTGIAKAAATPMHIWHESQVFVPPSKPSALPSSAVIDNMGQSTGIAADAAVRCDAGAMEWRPMAKVVRSAVHARTGRTSIRTMRQRRFTSLMTLMPPARDLALVAGMECSNAR